MEFVNFHSFVHRAITAGLRSWMQLAGAKREIFKHPNARGVRIEARSGGSEITECAALHSRTLAEVTNGYYGLLE